MAPSSTAEMREAPRLGNLVRNLLLFAGAIVLLYPLIWLVANSFKPEVFIFSDVGLFGGTFTFDNYIRGWNTLEVSFGRFIVNSCIVAALTIVGTVASCSLAAFAFAILKPRFSYVLFALVLASIMLPLHVVIIPQYIMFSQVGWVGSILPLVVPKFFAVDALYVFIIVQFMRNMPLVLIDAARVDGCNNWQIYTRIVLPLATPALVTVALLSFLHAWNDFFSQLVYLNDIERYTIPVGLRLYLDSVGNSDFGALLAMSTTSIAPMLVAFVAFQKYIVDGISTTGIRG
jgi:multiple sugar transport system permease protein